MTGYSDRINHALAFAAKHHDQQVRRGRQLPYLTRPANVAIILTRYGCDEDTIVAGILHDVVQDYVRDGQSHERMRERIGDKFGDDALDVARALAERRADDDGVEMTPDERREDVLKRIPGADTRALWVLAADNIHTAGSLLADLERSSFQDTVWTRASSTRGGTVEWLRRSTDELAAASLTAAPLTELRDLVGALERVAVGKR